MGLAFLFFFIGCNQQPNSSLKKEETIVIDTVSLIHRFDSNYYFAFDNKQFSYFDSAASVFNNVEVARRYPVLVRKMYGYALNGIPRYFNKTDNSQIQIRLIKQFHHLANEANIESLKTWSDYYEARYLNDNREDEIALPKFLEIYQNFETLKDTYGLSVITKRIGIVYLNSYQDYRKSSDYLLTAMKLVTDSNEVSPIALNLTISYLALNQLDSANLFLKKVNQRNHFLQIQPEYQIYLYENTSYGSIDSIQNAINELVKISGEILSDYSPKVIVSSFAKFSAALIKHKKYDLALAALNNGFHYDSLCTNCIKEKAELYKARYLYYQELNDYANAFKYLNEYNIAVNNLSFEKTKSKIEAARIKFEFEQQQKEEKVKQEQARLNDQQIIQRQKLIRNTIIGASFLFAIIALLLLNRYRLKRKIEMEKMRSRLSRDLHDDIGSTLSSINIISNMMQRNENLQHDEKLKSSIEKINERSQRLLDNMSDIVWSVKPENDSIEEIISRMREYATTIFESKGIESTIDFPKEKINTRLSLEIKNNFYLIFKEAVNNLAKYSQCKNAYISLKLEHKNLILIVKDDGVGFTNDGTFKGSGNGLSNMQSRADEINAAIKIESEINKGTTVMLSLSI